ncbi:MAG: PQQ-binding-like beta-propeller repeat protein [Pirellulales bacterium]|nr:PQQ-binding-like beta-propeller repeat protein [Pirellulales bacterium]
MLPRLELARFRLHLATLAAVAMLLAASAFGQGVHDGITVDPADWPWWRGPQRNGVANADQQPPTEWSATQNVAWKSPVPGRGHSSPTVVGRHVFLATADEEQDTQSVLCYDRATGKPLWQTEVHRGGLMRKHEKSSGASGTVACDDERLFISFANSGAVSVTALSVTGEKLWQTKIADYVIHQGYGASPAIYQSLVLAAADSHAGGVLAGLHRETGEIVWKHDRPKEPNYTSPIVLHAAGRDQLLLIGCNLVASFDPASGDPIWEVAGATTECVTSTVTDGERVFSSGGYPKSHLAAIRADGSGKIEWETKDRVYVPSLLEKDGFLYGVLDAGVAVCWKSDTGKPQWKQRLGGDFSSSPVLVGDCIYATNETGETYIYRARPDKYEEVGTNKLGEQMMGSATICGGRIYLRVLELVDGQPQEMLYCLAQPD